VGEQEGLQFGGGHLEALVLDELLDPVDDEQPAVGVDMADSPVCSQPSGSIIAAVSSGRPR
jgi:hypothetical protein